MQITFPKIGQHLWGMVIDWPLLQKEQRAASLATLARGPNKPTIVYTNRTYTHICHKCAFTYFVMVRILLVFFRNIFLDLLQNKNQRRFILTQESSFVESEEWLVIKSLQFHSLLCSFGALWSNFSKNIFRFVNTDFAA